MIDLVERPKAKAQFNKQELPLKEFTWYCVYQYSFTDPHLIGYDTEEQARDMAAQYKAKSDCIFADVTEGYPYEVAIKWKKK